MDARQQKGLQIAKTMQITKSGNGDWLVPSQSRNGTYTVHIYAEGGHEPECTCPDYQTRGCKCKHIYAVEYMMTSKTDSEGNRTITKAVRVTYPQDWKAYNKAQTSEIIMFDELLKDLVESIEEPEYTFGRPTLSLRESLFCAVQKVYSQLSSRRAHSLYKNAESKEQISHAPHSNAVNKFLNREDITLMLHELITLSAKPLQSVETEFAVDSTGFRTTSFGRYAEDKHGIRKERKWLKAHITTGVKTNIVTSVRVTDEHGADITQFQPMIKETANNGFEIREVYADKAYVSRENHELVGELGGTPFIPFKRNAVGKMRGSMVWKRMYYYFLYRQEEYMEHYNKRSNVESTIYAIKAKFGETLKSKKPTAQKNELLCKILAYNITVLIQEMYELRIAPKFNES